MSYLSSEQRAQLLEMRRTMDNLVSRIAEVPADINDNLPAIRLWKPGAYAIGDVRMHGGNPYKCVQVHDSGENPSWTPEATPALWMQYHGTSRATARAWIAPTGAQDMYRAGEYMIWTDGRTMKCLTDTAYSPDAYPQAWEKV